MAWEANYFRDMRRDAIDDIVAGVSLDEIMRRHHDKLCYGEGRRARGAGADAARAADPPPALTSPEYTAAFDE